MAEIQIRPPGRATCRNAFARSQTRKAPSVSTSNTVNPQRTLRIVLSIGSTADCWQQCTLGYVYKGQAWYSCQRSTVLFIDSSRACDDCWNVNSSIRVTESCFFPFANGLKTSSWFYHWKYKFRAAVSNRSTERANVWLNAHKKHQHSIRRRINNSQMMQPHPETINTR